jgi:hypothetical protein
MWYHVEMTIDVVGPWTKVAAVVLFGDTPKAGRS